MSKLKKISGLQCIKILCNKFEFKWVRQSGSHAILRKDNYGTVVPLHPKLGIGLIKNILKQAKVSVEDFSKYLWPSDIASKAFRFILKNTYKEKNTSLIYWWDVQSST